MIDRETARNSLTVLLTSGLLCFAAHAYAEDTVFALAPGGLSQAIFHSDAQLESITGSSNAVSGQVTVDLSNPAAASATVQIDAASFRTGIAMRDEDMQSENWLNAAAHPQIQFELGSVEAPEGATLAPATPLAVQVSGQLTLRGVTQDVTAPAEVTFYELDEETRAAGQMTGLVNNVLRIETQFSVRLADYGISVPPVLNLKVGEEISIDLRLTAVAQ